MGAIKTPQLQIHDVVTQLPSTGTNGQRSLRSVDTAVVHHDGVLTRIGYDPVERYKAQARYHISKGWNRLSYHFRIDTNGNIWLTNRIEEITWHAGHFQTNLRSLAICLDGDFTRQDPTKAQRDSLIGLLMYLTTERPDMPGLVRDTVKTHREAKPTYTVCPTDKVTGFVEAFRAPVCRPLI